MHWLARRLVGNSPGIRRVLEQVRQVAASEASVLLIGETGTGKSVLAHRIHDLSARRERALVRVNCASLSAVPSRATCLVSTRRLRCRRNQADRIARARQRIHGVPGRSDRPSDGYASQPRPRATESRDSAAGHVASDQGRSAGHCGEPPDLIACIQAGRFATICTTGSTSFRSTCRRCASAPRISSCWCGASSTNSRRRMGRRSRRSIRNRWPSCSAIPGRATRASCVMSSNAR